METNLKTKKSCISFESCFGTFYDILAQIISVLDVTTDIIVCIGFYQKDRMSFFGISLTIILLALIAYDIAFVFRFSRGSSIGDIGLFICLLPLTPLLPFVFYFTDSKETKLAQCLEKNCGFKIEFGDKYISDNASKLRLFMEEKMSKHFGFIIEALVEAFPQAILQLIAIVTYNEANIVSIISILLSMLSVASKSFVFSIATALNLKQLFFNWLCAITDFFGIFVVCSWVFYEPKSEHLLDAFTMIRNIWFYKLVIFEFIMIGAVSIGMHIAMIIDIYIIDIKRQTKIWKKFLLFLISFLLVTFLWGCGIIASVLVLEITNWTYLAGTFFILGTNRFSQTKTSSEFWFTMVHWINSAQKHHVGSRYKGCTSYTKKQDKLMRISAINYSILSKKIGPRDRKLVAYLNKHREESQYLTVTMRGIRENTMNRSRSEFLRKFWFHFYGYIWNDCKGDFKYYWNEYRSNPNLAGRRDNFLKYGSLSIGVGVVTFIFGPLYIISRFLTLLFPGCIVLYLYFGYDVNIWNTEFIEMFQVVMISIYLVLCVILSILFYMNCCEQYLLAHLLATESWIYFVNSKQISDDTIKDITNHYYGIVVIPIRRAIVIEKFGPDLGPIILSYLPLTDHYENSNNQVIKPKIVL